ncbi:MAG: NifB/NifX family molybdenum-iron cluster-binding protein [bacterium]
MSNSNLITAFATDNGRQMMTRHFGDADYYYIFSISHNTSDYITRVKNGTEEEREHADPKKAKGIAGLLKNNDVKVCVSPVFGPNIKRIKKKFVCIVMQERDIESAVRIIQSNFTEVEKQWIRGEERDILHMGGSNEDVS